MRTLTIAILGGLTLGASVASADRPALAGREEAVLRALMHGPIHSPFLQSVRGCSGGWALGREGADPECEDLAQHLAEALEDRGFGDVTAEAAKYPPIWREFNRRFDARQGAGPRGWEPAGERRGISSRPGQN